MVSTVIAAFEEFMSGQVNLEVTTTAAARQSRDWLVKQIALFPDRHEGFPTLYPDVDLHYGSFARRTKIRELDDLDMIIGVSARGSTYEGAGNAAQIFVPDGIALRDLCYEGSNVLNSRKVINKFVSALADVPQYEKADLTRNGSAAVLTLQSYTWSFDIVPGFFTTPEFDGRTYYLIPDGNGHWIKTDPRIDQERASRINQAHQGRVLNPLRLVKFWNRRPTMPSVPPYVLETIVLNYYEEAASSTNYVDIEFIPILKNLATVVLGAVQDPKNIQGDLNSLSWSERVAVSQRATGDASRATTARAAEAASEHKSSIGIWREILGPSFPEFG